MKSPNTGTYDIVKRHTSSSADPDVSGARPGADLLRVTLQKASSH